MRIYYSISEVREYINWVYLYHAWGVKDGTDEARRVREDADRMLSMLDRHYRIGALVELYHCYSSHDDIVLVHPSDCPCPQCVARPLVIARLPMLRQQRAGADGYCRCLADYIAPLDSPRRSVIGIFATSVDAEMQSLFADDPYRKMLVQTLSDRLAEAAAELLHLYVRTKLWGYAPDEHLTIADLYAERFQGIRPAVGYPCLPDISLNFVLNDIVDFAQIGITLTDHAMMQPHASVSGLMISHPQSQYFAVGKIDKSQLSDYAQRRHLTPEDLSPYLINNIENPNPKE